MADIFSKDSNAVATIPVLSGEYYASIDRPQINGLGLSIPWGGGTTYQQMVSGGGVVSTAPQTNIDQLLDLVATRPAGNNITYSFEGIIGPPGIPGPPGPVGLSAAPILGGTLASIPTRMLDDGTTPATPTGLSATAGIQYVLLEWTANIEPDMDHYEIWRHTANDSGAASKIGEAYQTLMVDGGLTGDEAKDIECLTSKYTQILEDFIKEYPDHWFWFHKRWKTVIDNTHNMY